MKKLFLKLAIALAVALVLWFIGLQDFAIGLAIGAVLGIGLSAIFKN